MKSSWQTKIVGQAKWATTRFSFNVVSAVYANRLKDGILLRDSFRETNDWFQKYCSKFDDELNAVLDEEC